MQLVKYLFVFKIQRIISRKDLSQEFEMSSYELIKLTDDLIQKQLISYCNPFGKKASPFTHMTLTDIGEAELDAMLPAVKPKRCGVCGKMFICKLPAQSRGGIRKTCGNKKCVKYNNNHKEETLNNYLKWNQ